MFLKNGFEKVQIMKTMNYKDVSKLGYSPYQARRIIQIAKNNLVKAGYPLYNNKRMGVVPITAIEKITGLSLQNTEDDNK